MKLKTNVFIPLKIILNMFRTTKESLVKTFPPDLSKKKMKRNMSLNAFKHDVEKDLKEFSI